MKLNAIFTIIAEMNLTADEIDVLLQFILNLKAQHESIRKITEAKLKAQKQQEKRRKLLK